MKKKIFAALIAAMTVFAPLTLSSSIPATDTVFAGETNVIDELPDWVPTDFETAVDFCNKYGATHIESGKGTTTVLLTGYTSVRLWKTDMKSFRG